MDQVEGSRPSEWNDDQRMSVLFSPFRNKEVNPKSYEKKLEFWRDLICNECKKQKVVSFNTNQLPKMFERKGKYPHCLNTVINDMLSKGTIMKLEEFKKSGEAGWLSWGFNWLVKKPVTWTYRSLTKSESSNPQGDYVMLNLVKDKCEEVLSRLQSDGSSTGVIEYKSLLTTVCDICKDDVTLQLILNQLQRDHKITISTTDHGEKVIKFATSNNKKVEAMTDTEMKIHRLNTIVPKLEEQIKQLIEDMQRCRVDAKNFLSQGLKNSAKNCLRRKRVLEAVLHKRENALENIHILIQQIKDTDTNKMILDAYAAGTSAYKEKVKDMTPEHIDDVMIGLQETLDIQSEINSAMSQSIEHPDDVPVSELESELDALLAAEAAKDAAAGDQAGSADMDSLLIGLQGLDVSGIGSPEFPEVPKFDPTIPPPPIPERKSAERVPQLSASSGTPPRQGLNRETSYMYSPSQSSYKQSPAQSMYQVSPTQSPHYRPTQNPYGQSPVQSPYQHPIYSSNSRPHQSSFGDLKLPSPPKTLQEPGLYKEEKSKQGAAEPAL